MAFDWNAPTNSVQDSAPLFGVTAWCFYRWIKTPACPVRVVEVGRKLRVVTGSIRHVLLVEEGGTGSPGTGLGDEVTP